MVNNVIGPIEESDWDVMILLRQGLREMKKDIKTYNSFIQEDARLYNKYLRKYLNN